LMVSEGAAEKRILVISADNFACEVIRKVLARHFEIDVASVGSGGDAIAEALTGKYSGAIIDHYLPGTSSRKIIKTIKTMLPGFPMMMMTSDFSEETLRAFQNLGIPDIIHKPFKMHALIDGITALIGAGGKPSSAVQV